jgi:hypothetical protein
MSEQMKLIVTATEGNEVAIGTERRVGNDVETRSYTLNPAQAVEFASAVLRAAEACGVTVQMQTAPVVTDNQRMAMVNRAAMIMRSMLGRKPEQIAMHVVDQVLSAVL